MSEKPSAGVALASLLLATSASAKMHGALPKGTAFPDPRFSTNDPRLKDPLVSFTGRRRSDLPPSPDETLARETREAVLCVLTAPASHFDKAKSERFLTDEFGRLWKPLVRLPQNRTVTFKRGNRRYRVWVNNESNGTALGNPREKDVIHIEAAPAGTKGRDQTEYAEDRGLTGNIDIGGNVKEGGHRYMTGEDIATPRNEESEKFLYRRQRHEGLMDLMGDKEGEEEIDDVRGEVGQYAQETEATLANWPAVYREQIAGFAAAHVKYQAIYRQGIDDIRAHCREKLERARLRPRQRR